MNAALCAFGLHAVVHWLALQRGVPSLLWLRRLRLQKMPGEGSGDGAMPGEGSGDGAAPPSWLLEQWVERSAADAILA